MPDCEILECTRAKFRYDATRVKLSNLVSEALSTLSALNQNWRNVWPKGMGWTNQYPKGQLDFDFNVWPQGSVISVIKDALLECHAANQGSDRCLPSVDPRRADGVEYPERPEYSTSVETLPE